MNKRIITILLLTLLTTGCNNQPQQPDETITRQESTSHLTKQTPDQDDHPPILHSQEFKEPIPLNIISTAGAEDSPFIPENSNELFFFFTPDPNIAPNLQLTDGVTGIYYSRFENNQYTKPIKLILQDKNKLSLDGCPFLKDNTLYVCSAREGYEGLHWVTAEINPVQSNPALIFHNWQVNDFQPEYEVGELHIHDNTLYFHSTKTIAGGTDIWTLTKKPNTNEWENPTNLKTINTESDESMPYINNDSRELWFTRTYKGTPAIFRSTKNTEKNEWQTPELIVEQFAGEPTLNNNGDLIFVHHYFKDGQMLEADLYIAKRN